MPIEALYLIGIVVLAAAFAFGVYKSRHRNKANDPIREEAVKSLYDDPEGYEHGRKQALEGQLRPER